MTNLVPEVESSVIQDFARVDKPSALEVVVEHRCCPHTPWERDWQLACITIVPASLLAWMHESNEIHPTRWVDVAEDNLRERKTTKLSRIELLHDRIRVCNKPR